MTTENVSVLEVGDEILRYLKTFDEFQRASLDTTRRKIYIETTVRILHNMALKKITNQLSKIQVRTVLFS